MKINYNSINNIKEILRKYKFSPKKNWGQNYLINHQIREKILKSLELTGNEIVFEIGPGLGSMTELLINKVKFLTVFEIDPAHSNLLEKIFKDKKNLKLIKGDFLKTFVKCEKNADKIFSNLPYSTASKIIFTFIEEKFLKEMVFTIQKELADRILANPRTKKYSSFTVLVSSYFKVVKIMDINESNFYPIPNVKSSTIKLIPNPKEIKNFKEFNKLIRTVFSSRRKKLKNTIVNFIKDKKILNEDFLKEYLKKRPEEISVDEFIMLSNKLVDF